MLGVLLSGDDYRLMNRLFGHELPPEMRADLAPIYTVGVPRLSGHALVRDLEIAVNALVRAFMDKGSGGSHPVGWMVTPDMHSGVYTLAVMAMKPDAP